MPLSELEPILFKYVKETLQIQLKEEPSQLKDEREERRQIMKKRRAKYEKKYHSYSSDSEEYLLPFQSPPPRRKRLEKLKKSVGAIEHHDDSTLEDPNVRTEPNELKNSAGSSFHNSDQNGVDATDQTASSNGHQIDDTSNADGVVSAKSAEDYAAELEQQAARHQDEINTLKRSHKLQLDKMRMEHARLQRLIAKKIGGFLGNKAKK